MIQQYVNHPLFKMNYSFYFLSTCAFLTLVSCKLYYFENLEDWKGFKHYYGKMYNSEIEENFRMKIFIENKLKIASHNELYNSGLKSYYLKMNEFGDKLPHEITLLRNGFKGTLQRNGFNQPKVASYIEPDNHILLPKSVDWRQEGAVTPIKNQGDCGSCWAFSAVGSLEGQHFRKTGKLVSLSEQNLVDCSTPFGNAGCEGGLMENAYNYVKSNNGIDTEESYPYEAKDDKCSYNPDNSGADDVGYVQVKNGSELALQKAVATVGPISVAIDADVFFNFYGGGIFSGGSLCRSSINDLNHGVLVVGYDTDETGTDYWIVKNSWGTDWGIDGYIYMVRNMGNRCGIATDATFPLV